MSKRILLSLVLLFCVLACCLAPLSFCGAIQIRRWQVEQLLTYPNAQNWQSHGFSAFGDAGSGFSAQFETRDVPETVYAFYARTLTRAGWTDKRYGQYVYSDLLDDYKLIVNAQRISASQTKVQLVLTWRTI
jgi:hypothetical protein